MPNQPRTDNPARAFRIDDALWNEVRRIAAHDETTPSEIVREAIRQYIATRHD
jgi:predicted transcriptional regulator